MSFGNPSNNRLGILGSLCSSGGVGSQTTLRAGCANSGSATNVRLWDSFKASGTLTVNPTSGSATENDDFDVKIVPPTVGTFWDSRIGANANNHDDGFKFTEAVTAGSPSISSSSRPRGDTKRFVFDYAEGETALTAQITVTGQIKASYSSFTYNVGDWCGGDSNSPTCVVTIAEEPE